jgi:hypothetical protein
VRLVLMNSLAVMILACSPATAPRALYDPATRELMRLDVDTNGDGVVDARTYLRGSRAFRSEIDADNDGRIDRWEYIAGDQSVAVVGSASTPGGEEDTWTFPDVKGEVRVDRLTKGHARRHEFYRAAALIRTEEDTNFDGLADKWETYENGRLRSVAVDTTHSSGRPDRRLLYDDGGKYSHLEIDSDRDGKFERVHE